MHNKSTTQSCMYMNGKKLHTHMNCKKLLTRTAIPNSFNWCSLIETHALLVHPYPTWVTFYHCFRSVIWHPAYTKDFDGHGLLILIADWNMPVLLLREAFHLALFQALNEMDPHPGCVPITQVWVPSQSKLCCCSNGKHSTIKWVWLTLNIWHSQS